MIPVDFEKLKQMKVFVDDIRWDVTPKIFVDPSAGTGDKPVDLTYGYMLYVEMINDRPALVIMVLKRIMSKSAGFIYDIPEDLLREAMECDPGECIAGMYPLTEKLEQWLKKEFGLSS